MMRRRTAWPGLIPAIALGLLGLGPPVPAAETEGERTFPLKEISILGGSLDPSTQMNLTSGARAECQTMPHEEVTAYPELLSKKPIYGVLRMASNPYDQGPGTPLYFVADESDQGDATENVPEEEVSILDRLGSALGLPTSGVSRGEQVPALNNTFNRLYVDLNGDLDLTNDAVVTPMKNPPNGLIRRYSSLVQGVVFREVAVPLSFGDELGDRPVRLIPRLEVQEYEGEEYPGVAFVPTVARKGKIKIGDRTYDLILAQRYLISGRYDNQFTAMMLTSDSDSSGQERWWGADQLSAMRLVGDTYYTTSTTPLGDRLTVTPYEGPMGTFKIGSGDRELEGVSVYGSLESKEISLAVGNVDTPTTECQLPAGDYQPNYVTINFGDLRLNISKNYHADGQPMGMDPTKSVYGIRIREDKPFVWDFSAEPDVMFASPAKDQTFELGDEVSVKGVLIDPKLGIMIRRLNKSGAVANSLDPMVTITNAAGKEIAEGPMPFGRDGTCGYSWRVPSDIELDGDEETFTITVRHDTKELYGKVKATRTFTIAAD